MMEQKIYKIDDKFFYSQISYRKYLEMSRYHKSDTRWSEKEDVELFKLYCEGHSIDQISIILCRMPGDIYSRLRKLNIIL